MKNNQDRINALRVRLGDLDVERAEYKRAVESACWDVRRYFPKLTEEQQEEVTRLIVSFYRINLLKNEHEEIQINAELTERGASA